MTLLLPWLSAGPIRRGDETAAELIGAAITAMPVRRVRCLVIMKCVVLITFRSVRGRASTARASQEGPR
jgi:hypothetical protein